MTRILADTNVFLRLAQPDHPDGKVAFQALRLLGEAGYAISLTPQSCYEYYVVATRPVDRNGLGMTPADAVEDIEILIRRFRLLRDERGIFDAWVELVERHAVRGKPAHDARLAAAALRHGITCLLTFNSSDFKRYPALIVLDPADTASFASIPSVEK